jgi:FkbM family methyltransferase
MKFSNLISNKSLNRILKILSLKYLIKSDAQRLEIIRSIVTNQYIEKDRYTLSNYGVWMLSNYLDKTFQLSIMGYRNNLEKILLSIRQPLIFLDIGANQGVFSLVAAKNNNFVEIHAFEPNLKLFSYLESNFYINKVNNFFIHKVAIGPESTSISFFVPENHSGNGRIISEESNMQVICVNRDYLNKVFTQSNKLYFIKIDVEGSEYKVLNELFNSSINLCIKYIFIEINTKFSEEDILIKTLRSNDFYEVSRSGNEVSYDALYARQFLN